MKIAVFVLALAAGIAPTVAFVLARDRLPHGGGELLNWLMGIG